MIKKERKKEMMLFGVFSYTKVRNMAIFVVKFC